MVTVYLKPHNKCNINAFCFSVNKQGTGRFYAALL